MLVALLTALLTTPPASPAPPTPAPTTTPATTATTVESGGPIRPPKMTPPSPVPDPRQYPQPEPYVPPQLYDGPRPPGPAGVVHAVYVDISELDELFVPKTRASRAAERKITSHATALRANASVALKKRLKAHEAQCAHGEVEAGCDADPILCAQDFWLPTSITLVTTGPREAVFDVQQPGPGMTVRVTTVLEQKVWKLERVECGVEPRPAPR